MPARTLTSRLGEAAHFVLTVVLTAFVLWTFEHIIGTKHAESHLQQEVLEALEQFDPLEILKLYGEAIGFRLAATEASPEYRACMRREQAASATNSLRSVLDAGCREEAQRQRDRFKVEWPRTSGRSGTEVFVGTVILLVQPAVQIMLAPFDSGLPRAHRLIAYCQILLGAYATFLILRWRWRRQELGLREWVAHIRNSLFWAGVGALLAILGVTAMVLGLACLLALALKPLAVWTLTGLVSIYAGTGIHIISKIAETFAHSAVHGTIERGLKP